MDLSSLIAVALFLFGLLVGWTLHSLRIHRARRRPKHSLKPVQLASDHEHTWNSGPYLHDPSLPAWLYTCTYPGCKVVLRSKVER